MRSEKIICRVFGLAAVMILVFVGATLGAYQEAQVQTELPQLDIPQPQFFCGYCHILTYPSVVQKGYELWKKGKHNKFGCVECHYPPREGEIASQTPPAGTVAESKHIPKKPPERFSYLQLGGKAIQTRPRVMDANCMTANCHGKPDD